MFLTGFSDEAGIDVATQLKATTALGWQFIESRSINGKDLATVSDAEFELFASALNDAKIKVNCFGSAIANWKRSPRNDEDFQLSKQDLLTAIPRMQKLGTKMVRAMSFKLDGNEQFDSPELEKIIFKKVNELAKICEDAGIIYGHENCMNYGGQSHIHTLRLLGKITSPAFKLIFDTGNPVFTLRRIGIPPFPLQSAWEFYRNIKEYVYYVHIKDCTADILPSGEIIKTFTFAGEGCGDVRAIIIDLLKNGYNGGFSIEPHLATIFHESDNKEDNDTKKQRSLDTYIEYGTKFERLLVECQFEAKR